MDDDNFDPEEMDGDFVEGFNDNNGEVDFIEGEEFIENAENTNSLINWEEKYNELLETFSQVCSKYNINKCDSCAKYRISKQCACGKKYCEKCFNESNLSPRLVKCSLCEVRICQRCTASFCECGYRLCRRHNMYECTAGCGNLICKEHYYHKTCIICRQAWCTKCIEGHRGCNPTYCSCGELVYPAIDSIVHCTICGKTSCSKCELSARKHRAYHSMIPFLIILDRSELPVDLPPEIRVLIWEFLLTK